MIRCSICKFPIHETDQVTTCPECEDQYHTEWNIDAHYHLTGREIWEQTDGGQFDAFVGGTGTGGTVSGVGRWIKAASPATHVIGVSSVGADAMEKSWREGRVLERATVSTIADGIRFA